MQQNFLRQRSVMRALRYVQPPPPGRRATDKTDQTVAQIALSSGASGEQGFGAEWSCETQSSPLNQKVKLTDKRSQFACVLGLDRRATRKEACHFVEHIDAVVAVRSAQSGRQTRFVDRMYLLYVCVLWLHGDANVNL